LAAALVFALAVVPTMLFVVMFVRRLPRPASARPMLMLVGKSRAEAEVVLLLLATGGGGL